MSSSATRGPDPAAADGGRSRRLLGPGGSLRRRQQGEPGNPTRPARAACPDCGMRIRDPIAARLGFCDRCQEFTGMCGAGRRIVSPDMMTMTSWHTPCTNTGLMAWEVSRNDAPRHVLLCAEHDSQVRSGLAPWIGDAIPLDNVR